MINYQLAPPLLDEQLNELFACSWPGHSSRHFGPVLARSLTYIAAFDGPRLVGFINVAWDGGAHAFVLDTTVRGSHKRKGIGRALVSRAVNAAREAGVEWVPRRLRTSAGAILPILRIPPDPCRARPLERPALTNPSTLPLSLGGARVLRAWIR
jgi:GNAT superfamily N-acetyltransferase